MIVTLVTLYSALLTLTQSRFIPSVSFTMHDSILAAACPQLPASIIQFPLLCLQLRKALLKLPLLWLSASESSLLYSSSILFVTSLISL